MSRRAGSTLIELLASLVVTGIVILGTQWAFVVVTGGAASIRAARENLDRGANARRWLKGVLLSVEPPFAGYADRVSFTSWRPGPGGWFEPELIELRQREGYLTAQGASSSLDLLAGVRSVAFDYLIDASDEGKWAREWISPVSTPLAVRLRVSGCETGEAKCADTLLFLIKGPQ